MAEAEAKLRKIGAPDAASAPGGAHPEAHEDDGNKKVKLPGFYRFLPQPLGQHLLEFFMRRGNDLDGICSYLVIVVVGHWVAIGILMQPPDALAVRMLRVAFAVVSCCFNLSWLSIIYYGPGRPPEEDPGGAAEQREPLATVLPPALAAAMGAGRLCSSRPFGAEGSWCQRCQLWKHPLTHHCSKCDQCSIWMDHHCRLVGQCIGFRNMRCFLVWLVHGIALYWCLVLLTIHRLYRDGWPQDYWCLRWLLWFAYLFVMAMQININFQGTTLQLAAGWHGKVVRMKFEVLFGEAVQLEGKLRELHEGIPPDDPDCRTVDGAANKLAEALRGLRSGVRLKNEKNELLWGPFVGKGADTLRAVFGSPCSWRWALPCVPGGTGDPFYPPVHSERGCKAWAALVEAMEDSQEVYSKTLQARRDAQKHLSAMLSGLEVAPRQPAMPDC